MKNGANFLGRGAPSFDLPKFIREPIINHKDDNYTFGNLRLLKTLSD